MNMFMVTCKGTLVTWQGPCSRTVRPRAAASTRRCLARLCWGCFSGGSLLFLRSHQYKPETVTRTLEAALYPVPAQTWVL